MPSSQADFELPSKAKFAGSEYFRSFKPVALREITRDFEYPEIFNEWYRLMIDADFCDFLQIIPETHMKVYSLCLYYSPHRLEQARLHALISFRNPYTVSDFHRRLRKYMNSTEDVIYKKPWLKKLHCLDSIAKVLHSFVCKPDLHGLKVLCVPKIVMKHGVWLHSEGSECKGIKASISEKMSIGSKFIFDGWDEGSIEMRGGDYDDVFYLHNSRHCKCLGDAPVHQVPKYRIERDEKYLSFFNSNSGFDYESFLEYDAYEALSPRTLVADYENGDLFGNWYHAMIKPEFVHSFLSEPRIKIYSMCLSHTKTNSGEIKGERLHALVSFRDGYTKNQFQHDIVTNSQVSHVEKNLLLDINCLDHAMGTLTMICYREGYRYKSDKEEIRYARKVYKDKWSRGERDCYWDKLKKLISEYASRGSKYVYEGETEPNVYDSIYELHCLEDSHYCMRKRRRI